MKLEPWEAFVAISCRDRLSNKQDLNTPKAQNGHPMAPAPSNAGPTSTGHAKWTSSISFHFLWLASKYLSYDDW